MDVTPSWLPGQRAPEEPDLAAMEALAGRPVSERWPWLADLEAWARHPRPEIRAAVLRCLFGCDGKEAEALVVAGLHDGHEIVWRAALEALAQTPAGSFQLLVHAATHPEVAVRRAAIPAVLARWQVLGARMLADPDARDEVVAAMGRSVMLPTTIDPALQHVALGHLPTPAFARWTLSLTWSHPWNVITNVHPVRHVAAPSGQPTPPVAAIQIAVENAAKQADGLDALFAAWREDQGVSATIAQAVLATSAVDHVNETRLCMAALLAATRDPDLPASWVALAARRWPAVLGWDALPASTRRRAAAWLRPDPVRLPKPVPVDMLDPANLLGPPLDVELVLTLLRIGPPDTLVAMSTWLDAPTFVALARARPEAASAILTSPGASAESCSAQRITWMKAVIAESANAVELVGALVLSGGDRAAEAVAALPRDAVPTWLGDLDRLARRARPERVQHAVDLLAKRKPPPRFADLKALLAMEDPGPVTQGLTGRLIGEQKPETLARLTHAELTRLAAWDAIAPLAPWEHLQALGALLPPELARRFGWVPPEPGHPLERDLPAPGPPREIRRKEANALASASVRELAERVAPFTTTSVTGLIAALGTRRHRSELACVACLASRDPLAEVASGLDRNGLPSVLHAVDLRMVVLWSGREDLSPAAALWLYRFDPPLERFLAWAEERAGGLAWVLEESQGWASAELRERAWRAAVRHAQRARWRRRPIPADLDRIALRARTSLPALAAELRVALGTEQLPTPPRPPTSAPTIPSVPVPVPAPEVPATPTPEPPAPTPPPPPPVLASATMLVTSDGAAKGWCEGLRVPEARALARSAMIAGASVVPPKRLLQTLTDRGVDPYAEEVVAEEVLHAARTAELQDEALTHLYDVMHRARAARRLAGLVLWGRQQARKLLGRSFRIEVIGGDALGWTRLHEDAIHINPVAFLRGERDGEDVARGLIVHELGHHLYNADAQGLAVWKRANDAGLGRLHNLVCDEHLERNLRVFDPIYGDHLKRLAAWAFQHAQREIPTSALANALGPSMVPVLLGARLGPARRNGHVTVGVGRLLRGMDATSSFGRFVRALRMGLGNREGDARVAAALALFGPEFRRLDNEGLWKVTEALRDLFGDECKLADLVDLHETAGDDPGDGKIAGRGVTSDQVDREADGDDESDRPTRRRSDSPRRPGGNDKANVGAESDFQRIDRVEVLPYDPAAHRQLASEVALPARHLRRVLERLGLRTVPVKPRLSGNRLDRSRLVALAIRGEPRVLISRRVEVHSDLFVGLVVDCSGSMNGARIERARRFAALVAEACRGLPGVDLRIFGFTDKVIFDGGDAVRPAAHALRAGGGNNDAAGLHHAAEVALASRRRGRLLVMISDGAPTECTTTALRKLVQHLERRRGVACAQVVVNRLNERCFDTYLEVLDDDVATAVRAFGAIVARLVTRTLSTSR